MVAVRRSGSTVTADIARVSISTPPSAPGIVPWPVARTATGRRGRGAKRTAGRTSGAQAERSAELRPAAARGLRAASYYSQASDQADATGTFTELWEQHRDAWDRFVDV